MQLPKGSDTEHKQRYFLK